jgi:hypothetical protein
MRYLALMLLCACGSVPSTSDGGTGGGGSAGGGAGGGSGGGGGGPTVNAATACPHVDFGTTSSISYSGDTTGLPNWVESQRLEWSTAPDDSLVFTATQAGQYAISLTHPPGDAGNFRLGVSVRNFDGSFYTACPAPGSVLTTDGVFEVPSYPVTLTAGQRVLMFVSSEYWSTPMQGRYTLTVTKQ